MHLVLSDRFEGELRCGFLSDAVHYKQQMGHLWDLVLLLRGFVVPPADNTIRLQR